MSLSQGYQFLSIPGPSMVPDRVLRAMHRPSPNIYEGELAEIAASVARDLKVIAGTKYSVAMYLSNGHGAWEAAAANTLAEGDTVLVLGTGRFGPAWGDLIRKLGVTVIDLDFGLRAPAEPNAVEEALRKDTDHKIKAVLTVQADTASSVRNDIPAISAAIQKTGHPALFMVDCICSFGCEPHQMDEWGVDVMVSACQKGMMTPTGVGFVFFNDSAKAIRDALPRVSSYWDWKPRSEPEQLYQYFCGTAATHHLFGLREALNMIQEEGFSNVLRRHHVIAQTVWAAIDAWGHGTEISHNISDPNARSWGVSAVRVGPHEGGQLRKWTEHVAGCTLGIGLGLADLDGPRGDDVFRIGHMGALNIPMIMGTLGTIDAGFKALGIAHGDGALEAASAQIATLAEAPSNVSGLTIGQAAE
ncbi:MAG: aminotransferase class V-fold PLP-dependent enzyme [Pseudomonadota bacterium]